MSRAILFKIEVKDSYKEGGPRIHRTIEVITETLTMKVFIVMRNDKIDQVFFNVDPAIARTAAEARSCELTAKWAITRVVEQEVIEVGAGPVLADVSANLVYEWVRTGHWNLNKFTRWLGAKHIDPPPPTFRLSPPMERRWSSQLVYQHIKTKCWPRWQFAQWVNSFL